MPRKVDLVDGATLGKAGPVEGLQKCQVFALMLGVDVAGGQGAVVGSHGVYRALLSHSRASALPPTLQ
jgi:hypothetical protein